MQKRQVPSTLARLTVHTNEPKYALSEAWNLLLFEF